MPNNYVRIIFMSLNIYPINIRKKLLIGILYPFEDQGTLFF
jgi:hypothetical protein